MRSGFTKPLYLLPFDHRESFQTKLFGWQGPLTEDQANQIARNKQVIYEGFKAAMASSVPEDRAGILVDEQFGAAILRDAATVRRNGRDEVSCIVLGRGADEKKVSEWLTTASRVPGFIGFAVGRTTFWESLVNFRRNKISRDEAAANIAGRYQAFVDVFQSGTMPP